MSIVVDIDNVSTNPSVPKLDNIRLWVKHGLSVQDELDDNTEVSVRIVDADEIQALNLQYRDKDKPTNVLSFPAELPEGVDIPLLGDIVICAPVVEEEAITQHKIINDHWAHMLIHGTLHLLGYDHIDDNDAEIMENLEVKLLKILHINSPY